MMFVRSPVRSMRLAPEAGAFPLRIQASRQNLRLIGLLLIVTVVLVAVYSVLFQLAMALEGQHHSWVTAVYWVTTNMSTLGLGDVAFTGDLGRAYTVVVHGSGLIILLILIPFLFVQMFQSSARVPRQLPAGMRGHVILTNYNPLTVVLIKRLTRYRHTYALIIEDLAEALRLHDLGFRVVVGDLHDPDSFRHVGLTGATLVACTGTDQVNTNTIHTIREVSQEIPIISTASTAVSVDVLRCAGSTHVLQLADMMGQSLARRIHGADAMAHVVGQVDDLLIAEATAAGTPLVGKTLQASKFREVAGITVVGLWERGEFVTPQPETMIHQNSVLLLAGSQSQVDRYNELFCIYHVSDAPVVVVGAGRVGRVTGRALSQRTIAHRFIEQSPERARGLNDCVVANAMDMGVLENAGIRKSSAVVMTTHDDDTNIFLTTFCRMLRPDIQILSLSTHELNVRSLHHAGADFVISDSSMGANAIFNVLKRGRILMVTEGLNVFEVAIPPAIEGKTIADSLVRKTTGCSIIGVNIDGALHVNPDPRLALPSGGKMILIGTVEAEEAFLKLYTHG